VCFIWVQQRTAYPEDGGNVACRNDGLHLPDKASLTCRQTGLAMGWVVRSSNPAGVRHFLSSRTVQSSTGAEVQNKWSYASTPPLCLHGCRRTILKSLPLPRMFRSPKDAIKPPNCRENICNCHVYPT